MTPRPGRSVALLVVVFVAGLAGGAAIDRVYLRPAQREVRIRMKMPDVLDRLDLSADQRRAADSVFRASSPRSEAAMRELAPRLSAIADSVDAELRTLLTPTQRARLDSLTKRPAFILKRKDSTGIVRIDTIRTPTRR